MALGGEETSFPRGKEPTPGAADGKQHKKGGAAATNGGGGAAAAGGPAAKRKREAKAAGAAASSTPAAQADSGPDFLFGGLPKKKPKQQGRGDEDGDGALGGGKVDEATKLAQAVGLGCVTKAGRGPPEIQPIAWKKLGKGTTVLGLVARVGPRDVAVSLPGGMVGRVTFPEVSDPLYARFAAAAQAAAGGLGGGGAEAAAAAVAEAEALAVAALQVGQVVRCAVLAGSPGTAATEAKKAGGKGGHRLALSLRTSLVNRGMKLEHLLPGGALAAAVASEEDHGYVLNTGLEGVTAFLPKKHANGGEDLSVGQPLEAVVLAVNEGARALTCGHDPAVAPQAITRGLGALTLQGLKPGMLVNAVVDMVLRNGLALSFLGGFSGVATLEHLDRAYPEGDWRKRFRLGDVLPARVLLVDYQKKAVYLTLRPHLLGLRPASSVPAVGTRLEGLTVLRVDKKKGLLLGLPVSADAGDRDATEDLERARTELEARAARAAQAKKEGEDDGGLLAAEEARLRKLLLEAPRFVPVLVHASQVDRPEGAGGGKAGADPLARFSVGQAVEACRVVGAAPVEGAAHGSLKAETLSAPFVRVADVAPGQLVEAEVAAVAGWGLTLDLGQGIKAHCTNMHLADGAGPKATALRAKAVAEAKKKGGGVSQQPGVYKTGQRVACRVLQVDPQTRKVYATLKRSLVKDPAAPLARYAEAQPGRVCLGFVTKVGSFGVIVTFYGNVHGLLPAAHLAAHGGVEDPTEAFRVGQVLRCVVHSSDPFHDPPRLSLRLDVPSAKGGADAGADAAAAAALVPGTRVSGVVERVQDPYVHVRVDAAPGETKAKKGKKGSAASAAAGPVAMLHKHHLGDHAALADQLLARVAVGQRIEGALVLESRREGGALLSLKPLLLGAKGGGVLDAAEGSGEAEEGEGVPKLTELRAGSTRLCGYVARVEPFGLFVRFVGGQVALAPRALIADRFVEDAQGMFREGDSVRSLLARVDADKGKAFVTTQRSKLPVTSAAFLATLLAEEAAAAGAEAGAAEQALDWRRFPIGATINATVTAVKDYGVVLSAAEDTRNRTVLLAPAPEHVLACAPGDEVKVRVLDVDWAKRVLVVTLLPDLVKRGRAKHRKAAGGAALGEGARAEATVVLKRDRYAVVEVGGALAYLAVADYQCPYLATGNLEVGVGVEVVVRRAAGAGAAAAAVAYPQEGAMLCTLAQEAAAAEEGAKGGKKGKQQKGKEEKSAEERAADRAARKAERAERKAARAQERAEEKKGREEAREARAEERKQHQQQKKRPRAVPASALVPGARLPALVARVKPDELLLAVNVEEGAAAEESGSGKQKPRVLARVFVTHGGRLELADLEEALQEAAERKDGETALPSYHPFARYAQGQEVEAVVLSVRDKDTAGTKPKGLASLGKGKGKGGRQTLILECSLRPQDLAAPDAKALAALQPAWGNKKDRDTASGAATAALLPGACWGGVVTEVQEEGLAVALSRAVRGFVHALDLAQGAGEASPHARLLAAGAVGLPLAALVARVEPSRYQLQLSLRGVPPDVDPKALPLAPSPEIAAAQQQGSAGGGGGASGKGLPAAGDVVTGRIRKPGVAGVPSLGSLALAVQLGHRLYARLDATEVADPEAWRDQPLGEGLGLHEGQDVRCRVLSVDAATGRVDVSLRPSRLREGADPSEAVAEDAMPEEGQVVHGFVVSTTPKGCFVRLSRGVTARVLLKDLADGFVQNPGQAFPPGKLVAGRVLRVVADGGVDVSLRPSVVVGESHLHPLAFEDLKEGMKLKGAVTRVEAFGVFVRLEGSAVTGLCHVSEASDGGRVKDLGKLYAAGDVVKAYVLKVDEEKKRVSLSLKASRFAGDGDSSDDSEGEASESEEEGSEAGSDSGSESELEEEEAMVARMLASSSEESGSDDDDDDDDEEEEPHAAESESESESESAAEDGMDVDEASESEEAAAAPGGKKEPSAAGAAAAAAAVGVAGAGGFQWDDFDLGLGAKSGDASASSDDSEGSDDEDDGSGSDGSGSDGNGGGKKRKHRSSRKKAAKRRREEAEVRAREERLLDPDAPPETADDFERLVLASPNSSYVWIRYMAYHLSLADVDAARALAGRALKTIVFREEGEKMNVWVALLNLEHRYGSKESVRATLEEASKQAHPKHLHLHAAEMYERAGQLAEAEELFASVMVKKFKYSKQVWMRYHALALKRDPAAATELLRRSLQCLGRHKHALVISHFAQAEFESGSVDRGRTIFEGLVSSYPRRLDLWNVYVDKEVKAGHIEAARRLLDRMCTLRLSAPKMKGVLKRYLKLEMEHGDAASVEAVKERARQYVEQSLA